MLAFLTGLIIAFAESGGHAAADSWYGRIEPYLNYPGFEAWRFLNLSIFVLIMFLLLRKPLSNAFKEKRDSIRADLIRLEKEKKAATALLTAAEEKLATIEDEQKTIIEDAQAEADAELARIEGETENDIRRVQDQAATELSRKTEQVQVQLRRFSAEESIRLAEEKIRSAMTAEADARLVKANIESIGGLK